MGNKVNMSQQCDMATKKATAIAWRRGGQGGDMIAVFNYIKGRHVEERASLFTEALESSTKSNGFKLQEKRFQLNSRKHFLTVRAVRKWNMLPRRVVESPSLKDFRRRLDKHLSGVCDF